MRTLEEIKNLNIDRKNAKCGLCANNCQLDIYKFNNERYMTGNRCERPLKQKVGDGYFNMYKYKYEMLFEYEPLTIKEAKNGVIGIPRALNIYEHYPFWFNLFTKLGFRVELSKASSKGIYELGMQTVPSESLCYPAKLVNGHVQYLIDQGIRKIFYPTILYESSKEDETSDSKKYSCPVVTSYPEVIKHNMDSLKEQNIDFINPLIAFTSTDILYRNLKFLEGDFNITKSELKEAVDYAYVKLVEFKEDIVEKTKEILEKSKKTGEPVVVLSGRPYHLDPEINHGIDNVIVEQKMHVLEEESVSSLNEDKISLRVVDQWEYHSRLYKAANYVGKNDNLNLVQLTSFGCGIDSITSDQVKDILNHYNKIYTNLKIDEGENLGAAKIRMRSLRATLKDRVSKGTVKEGYNYEPVKLVGNIKEYTILAPQMSPTHFDLIEIAARSEGYNVKVLPDVDKGAIDYGLKYVHNDSCYPALVVIGQMLKALELYDLDKNKVALLISQTGGGCRATNYIALLRRGLKEAGYENIPVIALNAGNVNDVNVFPIDLKFGLKALKAIIYGDALLRCVHRMRPYETNKGETDALHKKWKSKIALELSTPNYFTFRKNIKNLINDFDSILIDQSLNKPKVGIVGEILVKYHPTANNNLVKVLEDNGAEAVIPDFVDFFLYGFYGRAFKSSEILNEKTLSFKQKSAYKLLEKYRGVLKHEVKKSNNFTNIHHIKTTAKNAEEFLSVANDTGEGWFLTGEIINLLKDDINNIICVQPFGCLPNHIVGKGMFKALREKFPKSNLCAIDYDPGASEVNQISRIKLMLSIAHKNI